ncbi:MAG: cardiolipin synthase [Paracoccaceae bacterium]|nr:cardiolipin synthase [Paracoccaceae bacterium]
MTLTPLISVTEARPALERLCASAQEELCLSYRLFDPHLPLVEPRLTERGMETWADLIAWLDRRGVGLRILLADADPLLAMDLHRQVWRAASGFADVVQGDAQILCAPHGQRAGALWRVAMAGPIRRALRRLRDEDSTRLTPVQRAVLAQGPLLRPATHHHSFAIADGQRCTLGGPAAYAPSVETDVEGDAPAFGLSVQILDSDFAGAVRGHFMDCWNAALDEGAPSLAATARRFDTSVRSQSRADLRLLRSYAVPRNGMIGLAPEPQVTDHDHLLLQLFAEATRYIYVETQALRHAPLVEALTNRAVTAPDLQLIVVLPASDSAAPEGGDAWHPRHGAALQAKAIDKLKAAFGDRLALVTPGPSTDLPALPAASPVNLQANVLLIDDAVGVIGSANLTSRSMRWDSEASVLFRDAAGVARLMDQLADKWLGAETEGDPRQAQCWTALAKFNASQPVEARAGVLLPYPEDKTRGSSKRSMLLPDEMF